MKILCFYSDEKVKDFLSKTLDEITFLKGDVQDYENFDNAEKVEIISCFTSSKMTAENIEKFPNLKFIAARSTGFDHIDLKKCKELGIQVANVPTYGSNTVAEYAFSLLLAISRKAYYTYEKVKEDLNFSRRGTDELKGFDLRGKTIGIIGLGNIGKYSARIAHGFGMNILSFDINKDEEYERTYGVKYVEMDELFANSDVITLHVPLNEHTRHMINDKAFSKMKKGIILINTSRGEVVDTKALKFALDDGTISFAGLDVVEYEAYLGRESVEAQKITPEIEETINIIKEFIKMDNVIVTPHNAFNTHEAIERINKTTAENIKKFIGGNPQNLIL